jgi:ABC-type branched-subunit amino acid transport system substrate-binding protein
MKGKRLGLAIVVVLVALLGALPGLAGCAGGESEERVVKVGILADFTGTAAFAMQPTMKTADTYVTKVVPEKNPLPGVKVEFTIFDTQLNYSRTIPGYLELKGRGVDMMIIPNAQDVELLGDRLEQDKMPVVGTQGLQSQLASEWSMSTVSTVQSQGETVMRFIMDRWDYEGKGRSPVVGHLGYTLTSTEYYQQGIDLVRNQNPEKFTWKGIERGTLGNVTWTSEVGRLKTCDYILVSVAGPMLSSFVSQARNGGYTGVFITGMEGFPGFFGLVQSALKGSPEQLYDCYYLAWWPWWNEDLPYIEDCLEYIDTYAAGDKEELLNSSAVISGWGLGMVVEAAIRNAIEEVGADNLDRVALKNGMRAVNMAVAGFGDVWKVTPTNNCLQWQQRAFEWDLDSEEWVPLPTYYDPVLSKPAA